MVGRRAHPHRTRRGGGDNQQQEAHRRRPIRGIHGAPPADSSLDDAVAIRPTTITGDARRPRFRVFIYSIDGADLDSSPSRPRRWRDARHVEVEAAFAGRGRTRAASPSRISRCSGRVKPRPTGAEKTPPPGRVPSWVRRRPLAAGAMPVSDRRVAYWFGAESGETTGRSARWARPLESGRRPHARFCSGGVGPKRAEDLGSCAHVDTTGSHRSRQDNVHRTHATVQCFSQSSLCRRDRSRQDR